VSDFLSDTDRVIVDALVEHRVATASHLNSLLEVPERTIRYRLTQLRARGFARAVRPPAEKGSAPDHWCPTRKADSWAKGNRSAQGGDRHAPSTTFVEHSAAITSFYVALTAAVGLGLQLIEWVREATATEEFEWRGRARKIVPDAFAVVADKDCECRAFIEIDLGSMSMTRLSQKLSGYAAYYAAQAWSHAHPFAPVLLLLTTSERRAEAAIRRFEQRWAQAQRHLHSSYLALEVPAPEIAACAAARNADEAVSEPVWLASGGGDGLHFTDLIRPVWEKWVEQERARRELERRRQQWQQGLAADPEACREEIQRSGSSRDFEVLTDVFDDDNVRLALKLLLHREGPMNATERAAFAFFPRRLGFTRRGGITATREPQPVSTDELRRAQRLAAEYLDRQKRHVARLWARCPESLVFREAIDHLDRGALLRGDEIARLPALIATHRSAASDLKARLGAYLSWRQRTVEMQRRNKSALSRLVFDRERAAYELDVERLCFCARCRQIAIPKDRDLADRIPPECCFCSLRAQKGLRDALKEGLVRLDDDGFWTVCHLPVPAWVTKEAQRPLAQSGGPHEEW
jgi:hypothetical protein